MAYKSSAITPMEHSLSGMSMSPHGKIKPVPVSEPITERSFASKPKFAQVLISVSLAYCFEGSRSPMKFTYRSLLLLLVLVLTSVINIAQEEPIIDFRFGDKIDGD